jgi:hypothetical protein
MCLELIYQNSQHAGVVDFSYLAINEKIIVNKTNYGDEENPHGGFFNSHLWVQWNNENSNIVITALLNYDDNNEWDNSLQKQLVDLQNNDCSKEVVDNIIDMVCDALHNSGFLGTYVGDLFDEAQTNCEMIYFRTVDFLMHEPSNEDKHPGYDT